MVQLNESHFHNMHIFRLEWQPGQENGYIHWYMDDHLRFGVEAEGLTSEQASIPNEPSYVILNTAISTSWGFPAPPPGCDASEYDCKDPTKTCGFNPGFCASLPAEFAIDYIRIYQNKKDPSQTIGCNPKEYPTKRFISAHEYRYKDKESVHALKTIRNGGGHCHTLSRSINNNNPNDNNNMSSANSASSSNECGEGECVTSWYATLFEGGKYICQCKDNWQGPHCLVRYLYYISIILYYYYMIILYSPIYGVLN
jgi:hypothetical protein